MTADWKDHKHDRATKRHSNLIASTQIIKDAGITFEAKDYGQHLIIRSPFRVDFWPTTGLWITSQVRGRGVRALIEFIKAHTEVNK